MCDPRAEGQSPSYRVEQRGDKEGPVGKLDCYLTILPGHWPADFGESPQRRLINKPSLRLCRVARTSILCFFELLSEGSSGASQV